MGQFSLSVLFLVLIFKYAAAELGRYRLGNEEKLLLQLSQQRSQSTEVTSTYLNTGPKCGSTPAMMQSKKTFGFTTRIIGGVNAKPGEQPWAVALKISNKYFCCGSIVREDVIVTAAHCLVSLTQSQLIHLSVVAGEYNILVNEGTEQIISVARVVLHPEYNTKTNYNNDIALLYLKRKIQYGINVQPICLPHPDDKFEVGMLCTVCGWGVTKESGNLSSTLQMVKLPIIDHAMCSYAFTSQGYEDIDNTVLCAGYPYGGKDACQGDSGGPFACKTTSGSWVLAGVVSYGIGCARSWDNESLALQMGSPGIFSRVSALMSFLTNQTVTEGCSAEELLVTGREGIIEFPLLPGINYTDNSLCLWTISVSKNKIIRIFFTRMDIENSVSCANDYLAITSIDGILAGKVCGRDLPSALLVRSSKAILKFVSDDSVTAKGFTLTFTEESTDDQAGSGCGSVAVLKEAGTIDTINYPGVYTPLTECHWLIEAPLNHVIQFVFEDFCLEYDKNCRYDRVKFFDDEGEKSLLATFCGCIRPTNVTSHGNTMAIYFESDQENNYKGFKGRFTFIPAGLAEVPVAGNLPISVRTPIPKIVPIDVCGVSPFSCQWQSARIVGGEETRPHCWPWQVSIKLDASHHCGGTIINPRWILTAAHCMKEDVPISSFNIVAGGHDRCLKDAMEQVRKTNLIVAHQQFEPDTYDNDIALIQLNEPLIYNDYVRAVCLPTSSSKLSPSTVCVVTGWGSTADGGRPICRLQQLQLPVMDWDICDTMYSGGLTKRMTCAGFLMGGKDACQGDSGGPMMCQNGDGTFVIQGIVSWGIGCARPNAPGVYTTVALFLDWIAKAMKDAESGTFKSSKMYRWNSQEKEPKGIQSNSGKKQDCGQQTLAMSMGNFTSPGYPSGYAGGLKCTWLIPISTHSILKLEIQHLSIQISENCFDESLSIYEENENGTKVLDKLCGNQESKIYLSNGSLVKLYFSSNEPSSLGKCGFVGKYTLYGGLVTKSSDPVPHEHTPSSQESCVDVVLTEANGTIHSPGYPKNYYNNARCEWRIIARLASVITIYVQDFDTENTESGCQDHLLIYEGIGEFKKLLYNLCGYVPPTSIKSEGEAVTMTFISNSEVTKAGFNLTYTSHKIQSISRSVDASTGDGCPVLDVVPVGTTDVKSPYYPSTYPNKCDCKWVIYSHSGGRLQLEIYDTSIEYSSNCTFDSLRIYDGPNTNSLLLGNLCGKEVITLRSTGSYLTLHFQTDKSVGDRGFVGTCKEIIQESALEGRMEMPQNTVYDCGKPTVDPILNSCSMAATRSKQLSEKSTPRVIGGLESCPNSFPWLVSVQTKRGKHFCGACIITPTFLLTAAHCLFSPSNARILVGKTNLDRTDANSYAYVKNVYTLKEYNADVFPPALDIMLVELTAPLNIDPYSIICLPEVNEEPSLDSECVIAGWGLTNISKVEASRILRQASVSLISNEECISKYWDADVKPTNMCAGKPGSSSCMMTRITCPRTTTDQGQAAYPPKRKKKHPRQLQRWNRKIQLHPRSPPHMKKWRKQKWVLQAQPLTDSRPPTSENLSFSKWSLWKRRSRWPLCLEDKGSAHMWGGSTVMLLGGLPHHRGRGTLKAFLAAKPRS